MPEYRFDEIAVNSKEKKKPTEADKYTYIGLEHLDTGSLTVNRWGSEIAPTGEKLVMHKGDVLFGKRRAYQKKVAIAPFDGIFSAHGMVLRPRENVITSAFFPLFISSDYFLDEAIKISVGSLSPTINWSDLKELRFQVPTIDEQKRLAPVIWAAIDTKNAYQKLLSSIDELVKSQFIEMFGDPELQHDGLTTLGEHIDIINGFAFKGELFGDTGLPVIKIGNVNRSDFKKGSMQFYEYDSALSRFVIFPGDILISLTGTVGKDDFGNICMVVGDYDKYYLNQRNAKIVLHDELVPKYLIHLLRSDYIRRKLIQSGTGVRQCHLHNKDLEGIRFLLPGRESQELFATFIQQSDKSKFVAYQTTITQLFTCMIRSHIYDGGHHNGKYIHRTAG